MTYRFASLLLLLSASCGCRACSDCYDYSSPVSYSAAALQNRRAGTTFSKAKAADRIDGNVEMGGGSPAKIELTSYALDLKPQMPSLSNQPAATEQVGDEEVIAMPVESSTTIAPLPPLFAK